MEESISSLVAIARFTAQRIRGKVIYIVHVIESVGNDRVLGKGRHSKTSDILPGNIRLSCQRVGKKNHFHTEK